MCIRDSTKWAKYIRLVEKSINETYHDTIEMTPHQAHWGRKPKRVWEMYVDKELMKDERKVNPDELYQILKRKGEKRARKHNEGKMQLKFNIGDLVLIRTNPIS